MNLKELTKLIEDNGFSVNNVDDKLIIEAVGSTNNVPQDLLSFVTVYEKESSIENVGGVYKLSVSTMSANNFMKLLNSVFSSDYDFVLSGEYTIDITPKTNESNSNGKLNKNISLQNIAEEFDSEDVEIELYENRLKVISSEPLKWAESVDEKYGDSLEITIEENYITIEGK